MKILTASKDLGSAQSLLSPINRFLLDGKDVINVVTYGSRAEEYFRKNRIDVSPVQEEEIFSKVMEEILPDVILTGSSCSFTDKELVEHTAIRLARSYRIPSITILDFPNMIDKRFSEGYIPDRILVPDNFSLEKMIENGINPEKMVVTGNPHYDLIQNKAKKYNEMEIRRKIRQRYDIRDNTSLIFFASQSMKERGEDNRGFDQYTAFEEFLSAAERLKDIFIAVRPHPNEGDGLEEIIKKYEVPLIVTREGLTQEFLYSADIVVSMYSTVLIEAVYLGSYGISLQPGLNQEDTLVTNSLGLTVPVYERGKIYDVMKDLLSNGLVKQELDKNIRLFLSNADGDASSRVVDEVYKYK